MDVRAFVAQALGFFEALGFFQVGPVDLGIVLQFPGLLDAIVEGLSGRRLGVTPP